MDKQAAKAGTKMAAFVFGALMLVFAVMALASLVMKHFGETTGLLFLAFMAAVASWVAGYVIEARSNRQ